MTNSIEKEIIKDVLNNPGDSFYENVLSDFLDEQNIVHDFRKPFHNNKVTELNVYQEKCFDIWIKHWLNIGLCTKSTDERKAEKYFYNFHKKSKNIIWFNNPVKMLTGLDMALCEPLEQTVIVANDLMWDKIFLK
jgi:hypothetical protein